ncbi:MAG: STAS-like domain-containing protein, partial [Clostridia bacterium]|nr:STAS-like domain-containing protein [Clostridia bacterium]
IFEKIKKYFDLASLDDAICELFKGKLTTDKQNHSGEGIFFTSKLMDRFSILSSDKIFKADKFDSSNIISMPENLGKGTIVLMSLSNYTHKKSKEVFDKYSDINGGFTKTIIPLKNIFDGAPVSRSQARRVLTSLDKFEEVILDFDEIEWIGQGFAHQIFVVFKNQQPNIQIIPVNMNEDVTKMYNHVINTNLGTTV